MTEDELRQYNLDYTHEELEALLDKLENNEMLTKEQYKKLIEDIGLDNISTFDLNYYNLINTPTIPVRVSQLFNDRNYDTVASVNIKIAELSDKINLEIEELNRILGDLNLLDINTLLSDLNKASVEMGEIQASFEFVNKAIFSLERTTEVHDSDIESLSGRQEVVETHMEDIDIRLDNISTVQQIHTEDINNLNLLLDDFNAKQDDLIIVTNDYNRIITDVQNQCNKLTDNYNDLILNRMSELDEGLATLAKYKNIEQVETSIKNLRRDLDLLSNNLDRHIKDFREVVIPKVEAEIIAVIERIKSQIPTLTSQLINDSDYITFAQLGEEFLTRESLEDIIIEAGSITGDIVDHKIKDALYQFAGSDQPLSIILEKYITAVELSDYAKTTDLEALRLSHVEDMETVRDLLKNWEPDIENMTGGLKHVLISDSEFKQLSEEEQRSTTTVYIVVPDDSTSLPEGLQPPNGGVVPPPSSDDNNVPIEEYNDLLERVARLEEALETAIVFLHDPDDEE
jgi:RNase P/RNase MRP subunit POP5